MTVSALIVLTVISAAVVSKAGSAQDVQLSHTHDCDVCEAVAMQLEAALSRELEARAHRPLTETALLDYFDGFCQDANPAFQQYGLTQVAGIPLFTGPGLPGFNASTTFITEDTQWSAVLARRCAEVVGEVGEWTVQQHVLDNRRLAPNICNVQVLTSYCRRDWGLHRPHTLGPEHSTPPSPPQPQPQPQVPEQARANAAEHERLLRQQREVEMEERRRQQEQQRQQQQQQQQQRKQRPVQIPQHVLRRMQGGEL